MTRYRMDEEPIGQMRRRLAIEIPVEAADGAGGIIRSFASVGTVWAQVSWRGGTERWLAGRPEQAAQIRITMRWRAGMTAGMQMRDGARVFEIISVGDPDGNRRRLELICNETGA
jgi:SPP1 family predicted phage head-tail adaptor